MASLYDHNSISDFLAWELDLRKRRNPEYSLRAFARDLSLSASRLSEILNSSAGLSEKMATDVAARLKLKPSEKKYFLDLILASTARNPKVKKLAAERIVATQKLARFKDLRNTEFHVIADWYHSAIVELTEMKGYQSDSQWIAHQLGISPSIASAAVSRLLKLGLLREVKGQWVANPEPYFTNSEVASEAFQKFHQQILAKTLQSFQTDSPSERAIQTMILAVPKNQVPLFADKLKAFMQNFWEELKDSEKDDLYSVSLQITPIRSQQARQEDKIRALASSQNAVAHKIPRS